MSEYKVVIPLDGSRQAEHALAFLPALRHFGHLDVTLLSVVDIPEDLLEFVQMEEREREYNLLSTYLREIAHDVAHHLGATVHCKVERGAAASVILEMTCEEPPDLLVLSTHGDTGAVRWQRGAVADKVIRGACCPVLAVGPKAMEKGQWLEAEAILPFKRILVPLDGSDRSEQAIPEAAEYATLFGSSVHLVRVMPYMPISTGFWDPATDVRDDILSAGRAYLEEKAKDLDEPIPNQEESIAHQEAVFIGSPVTELEKYIKDNDIDLVIMTSHGRSGLSRVALGSVTDRVIGFGPPVLVLRTRPTEGREA